MVLVHKTRKGPNTCTAEKLLGNVCGKRCLLVEDILDTGGTLVQAATLLKQRGALVVDACVSHAVLSGQAVSTIRSAPIDKIYTTNSIPHKGLPSCFEVFFLANYLADAIRTL